MTTIDSIYDVPFVENMFFREFVRFFRETPHFRDIEMFCFWEIMLPLKDVIRTVAVSEDCYSRDIGISHFREITILQFWGD